MSSPRHEELAAVRGSEEERGCGVGGGERKGVGVALTRYRDRDPSVGRLFGSLFCLAVLNSNFARTNRGLLAATTGDKEKKKEKYSISNNYTPQEVHCSMSLVTTTHSKSRTADGTDGPRGSSTAACLVLSTARQLRIDKNCPTPPPSPPTKSDRKIISNQREPIREAGPMRAVSNPGPADHLGNKGLGVRLAEHRLRLAEHLGAPGLAETISCEIVSTVTNDTECRGH